MTDMDITEFVRARLAEDKRRPPAEVAALRAIVDRCQRRIQTHDPDGSEGAWELLHDDAWDTLYALAGIWDWHPRHNPAWKTS